MNDKEVLTYSSCTTLCLCERKFYWRNERAIVPARDDDSDARYIGSCMHVGLEVYPTRGLDAALTAIDEIEEATPTIGHLDNIRLQERKRKARAMVRAAALRWPVGDGEHMTEQVIEMPVSNPDSRGSSRTFVYRGKVDGIAQAQIHDWKGVADPAQEIQKKTIGYQTELYAAALMLQGIVVTSATFRLIARPSLQFVYKGDYAKKYGGDGDLYEAACFDWLINNPEKMIEHEMYINPGRIEQARRWLWGCSKRVLENRQSGFWAPNCLACHTWSRACEYLPLCEVAASGGDVEYLIGEQYRQADPHPELKQEEPCQNGMNDNRLLYAAVHCHSPHSDP